MLGTNVSLTVGLVATLMASGINVAASVDSDVRTLVPFRAYVGKWRGGGEAKPGLARLAVRYSPNGPGISIAVVPC